MTPYGGLLYFGLLAYVVAPVLVARAFNVEPRRFILPATLVMVVLQFALGPDGFGLAPVGSVAKVMAFAVEQWLTAAVFLHFRTLERRRLGFYAAVAIATLPLALAKTLPATSAPIVEFLGISYLTFRALDVIFGIQDGRVTALPAAEYFSYVLFFPAIAAGPIDRYRRFAADYRSVRSREALLSDLDGAVERFFRGLLYAFVIARLIDHYWLTPVATRSGFAATVSYAYAYSLHLFFDFAGYSAFAISVGYLFGVHMPENFDQPFLAKNIQDFWNRWHITLSSWLRDHVYGRFVLWAMRARRFKNPAVAGYVGIGLAFTVMGFWHGFVARYICYGLYHAVLMVGYAILSNRPKEKRRPLPVTVSRLITFHIVCFGFLIFSGRLF